MSKNFSIDEWAGLLAGRGMPGDILVNEPMAVYLHRKFAELETRPAIEPDGVSEQVARGTGFWSSCTGCYETEDGHPVGQYPYSETLGCMLGAGCCECGGIGAVWDNTDYEAMSEEDEAQHEAACNHQLAPCPCCGSPATYSEVEADGWIVTCSDPRPCVASAEIRYALGGDAKRELAETWNSRHPSGLPSAELRQSAEVQP